MKTGISFLLLLWTAALFAQKYEEVLPPEHIKTVMLFNPQTNDETPLIRIGSEYLLLSFDDLEGDYKEYNYKVEFYNADWTEAGIFQTEYLDGYSSNYIREYKNSFNTDQIYTHYEVAIPNRDMMLKIPGNYSIKVYTRDENKPLFTRRFAVYDDSRTNVGVQTERAIGSGPFNQRVNAEVTSGQVNLTETPDGATLFIMKNGNWKDHMVIKRPSFIQSSRLTYKNMDQLFQGGSEYLWFDTKRRKIATMNTERIFEEDGIYNIVLRPNSPLSELGYFDESDLDGAFYIRNADLSNQNESGWQAHYVKVHFALDDFDDRDGSREVYVVGAFNNWNIAPEYRLRMSDSNYWEVALYLKQGYYNYKYAVYDKKTGEVDYSEIDGSFWQTQNRYQALFYYRPWGVRYDMLIGFGEALTR